MFKLGCGPAGVPPGRAQLDQPRLRLSQADMQLVNPQIWLQCHVTPQVCLPNALTDTSCLSGDPIWESRARRMAGFPSLHHLDGVIAARCLVPTRCQELHMY